GIAVFAISISFGVLARPVMGTVAPIVMSILVFSGAAQFGALAVLIAGGGAGAAIAAGVLLNARYLAMGIALAPSLRGRPASRAAFALPLVDASWAAASRGDGTFDPWYLVGVSIPQYLGWVLGTVVGVLIGPRLGDPNALGLGAACGAGRGRDAREWTLAGARRTRPRNGIRRSRGLEAGTDDRRRARRSRRDRPRALALLGSAAAERARLALPVGDPAVEHRPGVEAGRLQNACGDRSAGAGLADRHQRTAVEQSGLRGGSRRPVGEVPRAGDVALVALVRLAHVEQLDRVVREQAL